MALGGALPAQLPREETSFTAVDVDGDGDADAEPQVLAYSPQRRITLAGVEHVLDLMIVGAETAQRAQYLFLLDVSNMRAPRPVGDPHGVLLPDAA